MFELYHHGVKGMKWGVRLYQKKDGSLTALGRYRYFNKDSKLTEAGRKALIGDNGTLSDRGLALVKAHTKEGSEYSDDQVLNYFKERKELLIKKGEEFVRYATPNEPLDTQRKYVAYGKELADTYREFADSEMLGFMGNDYAKYTYTTKKDMKVAVLTPQDIVRDYVKLDTLGQQKMDLANRYTTFTTSQARKRRDLLFVQRSIQRSKNYVDTLYSKELENIKPRLQKKGYDAVLDWNDANMSIVKQGRTEYPLIVLDPKKSIKLSKYEYH